MTVSTAHRAETLAATRALKMARSIHAYVRGNTRLFYEWLEASPVMAAVPVGPPIWICGDCHLGNLGPVADARRRVDFQIRDLDQAVIGNPALDLIRLALSLATAARSSDLPGVTTARMMEAMIAGYSRAMRTPRKTDAAPEADVVRTVRRRAAARSWRHLAVERLEDATPAIPRNKRFWELAPDERAAIEALFAEDEVRARSFELADLDGTGRLRLIDAAYWRKGCSSLGKLRYAVLIGVREAKGADERFALVDIKEAAASVAPVAEGARMPRDLAQRVVAGARALSPNLGERMIPARLLDKAVVLRELAPQDLKLDVEQFSRQQAVEAAAYLAFVLGRAHARQMDADQRRAWRARLGQRHAPRLQAPSWLWRSVVDLLGRHEIGYLEHCRRFALGG